jgi:hypothetical protein
LKKENQLVQITKKKEDQGESDMNLSHFLYHENTQIAVLSMQKTEDALIVSQVDQVDEVILMLHYVDSQRVFLITQYVRDSLHQKLFDSSSLLHGFPYAQYYEVFWYLLEDSLSQML